ncbi:unnamed protein product [Rotaria magnacalcarata]|uniref:Cdc37 Hsp90 binding domain-containing protein n=1 Tax=Rotaria magnacalcarata TaxID=392030 RepID=A0A819NDL6_9BILA|nr:unnamed protein product [Rotaria magnacalcarata]CAF3994327.1 unnamed protein product [Rotaria magnacalcarata]CAF4106599.1 unnamed protein product [Rotaria magnacalcarata]
MAKKPEEPIDHLSEKIVLGRLCEEVQRKNVFDENNDQQEKLMMLVDFINENAEAAFVIQYKNYGFNKVYNEDLAKDTVGMIVLRIVQQNKLNLEKYEKCLDFDKSQQILEENIVLVCQEAYEYLVRWSINIAMNDDYVGMARVSNQALLMEFILKLIKNKKGGTIEECTKAFFRRLLTDGQYREDFRDEHHMLEQHITKRAQQQNGTVEAECDDEAKAKNDQEEFREDEKD